MNISGLSSSRPDFAQMREAMFTKADADKSGGITKSELATTIKDSPIGQTGSGPDVDAVFGKMDSDGDGQISKTEMGDAMKDFETKLKEMMSGGGGSKMGADTIDTLLKALDDAEEKSGSSDATQARRDYVQKLASQLQEAGQSASLFKLQA